MGQAHWSTCLSYGSGSDKLEWKFFLRSLLEHFLNGDLIDPSKLGVRFCGVNGRRVYFMFLDKKVLARMERFWMTPSLEFPDSSIQAS